MLRTNSKEVSIRIRSFIDQIFDASGYNREDLNNANTEDKIKFIAATCWEEKKREKNRAPFQEMFIEWCQGLPSVIDTALYYCHSSAVDILGDILEQTKEERNKYTEPQAERMISYLIYRECSEELFKCAF